MNQMLQISKINFFPIIVIMLLIIAITNSLAQESNEREDDNSQSSTKTPWVPWKMFEQVEYAKTGEKQVPQFGPELQKLDGRMVEVEGFIIPLEHTVGQKHFLISAYPVSTCYFCGPGGPKGPEQVVEIRAREPIAYRKTSLMLRGRLELLENDPMGLLYRLHRAQVVK